VTWDEFRDRLQATLRGLTDRCYLIVSAPEHGYVQFAAAPDELSAEACGPEYTAGPAAHEADDPTMLAAGWSAPTRSAPNWSAPLQLPALTAEYRALADRCVTALRDVYGVPEPGVLTYQAWRDAEVQPPGVTWPPERFEQLDPGEHPLALPSLGLPPG
jgi:type III secretion system-like peptide-binding chaperone